MAETIKGIGIRWGVGGVVFTAGIVSSSNAAHIQSIDFERTSDKGEIKDSNGEVVGQVFYNGKKTLRLTVVPYHATTLSGARTSIGAHVIAPGTLITLTDSEGALVDDNYNLISAKARLSNSDVTMVDVEMESFDANEVATGPITT